VANADTHYEKIIRVHRGAFMYQSPITWNLLWLEPYFSYVNNHHIKQ